MKKWMGLFSLLFAVFFLGGCALTTEKTSEGEPLPFTVLSKEEIPEELEEVLETKKTSEMMMSCQIDGWLYLIRGYGEQESGGYSIGVNGVFLADDKIRVDTSLIGPSSETDIPKEPSCPYVVIKMEYMEKPVIFD